MAIESILYRGGDRELDQETAQDMLAGGRPQVGSVAIYSKRSSVTRYVAGTTHGFTAYLCRVLSYVGGEIGQVEFVTPGGAVTYRDLDAFVLLEVMPPGSAYNGIVVPSFTHPVTVGNTCRLFREGLPLVEPIEDVTSSLRELLTREVSGTLRPATRTCTFTDNNTTGDIEDMPGVHVPDGEAIVEHAQELLPVYLKMFAKSESRNADAIEAAFELVTEFDRVAQEYLG